jgi:HrpA-like RNA helicase
MYTREVYGSLMKFPVPEVLRVPLEKTVLDCKVRIQRLQNLLLLEFWLNLLI